MMENRRSPLVQGYLPERGMLAHMPFTVLENVTNTSVPDFHPCSEQVKMWGLFMWSPQHPNLMAAIPLAGLIPVSFTCKKGKQKVERADKWQPVIRTLHFQADPWWLPMSQSSRFRAEPERFPNLPACWRYSPHPREWAAGNSSSALQNAHCGQTSCYTSDENVNLGSLPPGVVLNSALCSVGWRTCLYSLPVPV